MPGRLLKLLDGPDGGGAAFSPLSLLPALWLDAGDSSTRYQDAALTTLALSDADPVGGWKDKSGNGNNALQSSALVRPALKLNIVNGRSVLRWSGSHLMQASGVATNRQAFTAFYVVRPANTTQTSMFGWFQTSGIQLLQGTSPYNSYQYYDGSGVYTDVVDPPSTGGFQIYAFSARTAGSPRTQIRVNGRADALKTQTSATASNLWLGGFSGTPQWVGDMAEVLIFSGSLTDAQIASVESYLAARYAIALTTTAWPPAAANICLCDGNSLTYGTGASDAAHAYPSLLAANLGATWWTPNYGFTGQRTTAMTAQAPRQVDPKLGVSYAKHILVAWEVTNDLYFGASAATAYSNYVAYCQARQAAGWQVVAATVLPRSDTSTPGTFEADRQTVNTNVRANWATFASVLADVAADTRLGDAGDQLDTTYYSADRVHLKDAGYAVVEPIVRAAVLSL